MDHLILSSSPAQEPRAPPAMDHMQRRLWLRTHLMLSSVASQLIYKKFIQKYKLIKHANIYHHAKFEAEQKFIQ
jgi:hypothetical protein